MKQPVLSELYVAYFILNLAKSKNILCIKWHLQERQGFTQNLEMFTEDELRRTKNYLKVVSVMCIL